MPRRFVRIGLVLAFALLLLHVAIIDDYGLTWDYHFHFFGGGYLLGMSWQDLEPRDLRYVPPDPRYGAVTLPYGAFMTVPPMLSYLLFYRTIGLLPHDVSYNLPITIVGVAGIAVLFFFLRQALEDRLAFIAAIFLSLLPRYFADLHNNMKDVPMAAVFALNMWLIWRLVTYRRMFDVFLAVIGFVIAFNTKINSLFIPVVYGALVVLIRLFSPRTPRVPLRLSLLYLIGAPILALALFGLIWGDLVGQLKHMWLTFAVGANNIEVLLNGRIYYSAQNVPWYYPYEYLAITTPLPILIFFIMGSIVSVAKWVTRKSTIHLLLLLWLFIPLTRYLTPKVAVIDGIRHFEEVVFPLAAVAAVGAVALFRWFLQIPVAFPKKIMIITSITIIIFSHLLWNIVSYHPFQITYFNELVGGVKGAYGKFDLDYWGASQKQAVDWLNKNARQNSKVHIVMAGNVAATYLRPDLLEQYNTAGYDESDYVVLLNRQSFFQRYRVTEYLLSSEPVYTVEVRGAPLVWVFDNKLGHVPRKKEWW